MIYFSLLNFELLRVGGGHKNLYVLRVSAKLNPALIMIIIMLKLSTHNPNFNFKIYIFNNKLKLNYYLQS